LLHNINIKVPGLNSHLIRESEIKFNRNYNLSNQIRDK